MAARAACKRNADADASLQGFLPCCGPLVFIILTLQHCQQFKHTEPG